MLKIAICDDMPDELNKVATLTSEYLKKHNIFAEVQQFKHPDVLLDSCEREMHHIYLLDMVMPMVSGIELGRRIRRKSTDAQIIYITTEAGFALDAYAVNPLHYLIKPVDKVALFSALDLAISKVGNSFDSSITIKTRDGLCTILNDSIISLEYAKHKVYYTLVGGKKIETVSMTESFSEHIASLLKDARFISPHSSYVVNMGFVERLDKIGFTLKDNIFVPVSGKQYTMVRNKYLNYRLGRCNNANL